MSNTELAMNERIHLTVLRLVIFGTMSYAATITDMLICMCMWKARRGGGERERQREKKEEEGNGGNDEGIKNQLKIT